MRFQTNQSSCGLAAMANALLCLGIQRSEQELAESAKFTAAEGTSSRGILAALRAVATSHPEVRPYILTEGRDDVAMLKLQDALRRGRPAILSVDHHEHWVVAFGLLGDVFHICDSANNDLVLHYGPRDLVGRWKAAGKRGFYAIIL